MRPERVRPERVRPERPRAAVVPAAFPEGLRMPLSDETIRRVRQMYADGVTVVAILTATGVTRAELNRCVDGKEGTGYAPMTRRSARFGQPAGPTPRVSGDRVALVKRIWRTAEAQVREIEARLSIDDAEPDDRERDARLLATLVKTLRELSTLDERQAPPAPTTTAADDDDIKDINEFRRDLARRMDEFVRERNGARVPGGAAAED